MPEKKARATKELSKKGDIPDDDDSVACPQSSELVASNKPHGDIISFLGLPFDIWTQIFRHAGVLCQCHVEFKAVNHTAGKHGMKMKMNKKRYIERSDFMPCAIKKFPDLPSTVCDRDHKAFTSILEVCRKARYMALKATFQEYSCHLELNEWQDLAGFIRTLAGCEGNNNIPSLTHDLKSLHLSSGGAIELQRAFFRYFGNTLKGKTTEFSLDCLLKTPKKVKKIAAMTSRNLQMLNSCNIRFYCYDLPHPAIPEIADLARRIVVNSTIRDYGNGVFRFMDLPLEIQEMVLRPLLVYDDMRVLRGRCSWTAKEKGWGMILTEYTCQLCSILKNRSLMSIEDQYHFRRAAVVTTVMSDTVYASSWSSPFLSPVPIFLASKYIHALASRIFFSENSFEISIDHILARCPCRRSHGIIFEYGFPSRHLRQICHLQIFVSRLEFIPATTVQAFARFAKFFCEELHLKRLDVDVHSWQTGNKVLVKALAELDGFQGKRPTWYQRANSEPLKRLN